MTRNAVQERVERVTMVKCLKEWLKTNVFKKRVSREVYTMEKGGSQKEVVRYIPFGVVSRLR
jgi:hypothetical protein